MKGMINRIYSCEVKQSCFFSSSINIIKGCFYTFKKPWYYIILGISAYDKPDI